MSSAGEGKSDPAMAAEAYRRYGGELQRFLVGLLRDAHQASDVLQTVFAKLVEFGGPTRPESRRAWLYRVAYREAMLVLRRRAVDDAARRRVAWSREAMEASAESPVLRAEAIDRVRRAIAGLPPEQQRIVRMRIYEEKTFAVIAQELGIPLGTALGRMRTAMKTLRSRLEHQE